MMSKPMPEAIDLADLQNPVRRRTTLFMIDLQRKRQRAADAENVPKAYPGLVVRLDPAETGQPSPNP
jgi:TATA-box binding protein (TBP) (component of TFIID and TFIIIB)